MKQIIKLIVDDQALDMGAASVSLTINSPYLQERGTHSLPFTIPLTERNREILGISHDVKEYAFLQSIEAKLHIGLMTLTGILNFSSTVRQGKLSAYFISGKGSFFYEAAKVMLNDIDHEETNAYAGEWVSNADFLSLITASVEEKYPDLNYVFAPVYMPNFPDDDVSAYPHFLFINHWDVDDMQFDYTIPSAYAPFFYVCCVVKELFAHFGYTIETDEFYEDEELRQTVVMHGNVMDKRAENFSFAQFLPQITCSEFIQSLEAKFNIRFDVNENSKTVNIIFNNSVLDSTTIEDISHLAEPDSELTFENYDGFIITENSNNDDDYISDNLPDSIDSLNNDSLVYDETDIDDFDSAYDAYDLAIARGKNELYQLIETTASTFEAKKLGHCIIPYKESEGNNNLQIDLRAGHLMMDTIGTSIPVLFPRSDLPRNLSILEKVKKILWDRLDIMIYRGLVPHLAVQTSLPNPVENGTICYVVDDDTYYQYSSGDWYLYWEGFSFNENMYPLLTNSKYYQLNDGKFATIPDATRDLNLFGAGGLFETFYKDWLYWYIELRRKEERVIHYDMLTLMTLDFAKKYRIDEQNYLIGSIEMQVDFANQRISFGSSELHSIH